jgi:hypothetical protein
LYPIPILVKNYVLILVMVAAEVMVSEVPQEIAAGMGVLGMGGKM